MEIGGLQKLTLIDFPGRISCTVFLSGCNFRCPFCYSSEIVLPEKIKKQPKISEKEFFGFLKEKKNLLEGVVICGGEPTINKDLPRFIKKIKKLGYAVKLDTNGSNPVMLKQLIGKKLIDYVAMDIKGPKEKYGKMTGKKIDIKKIEKSIKILKEGKVAFEFRTTIPPNLLKKEDIVKVMRWILSLGSKGFNGQIKYFLQNFRPEKTIDPKFEKIRPYSQEDLLEIQKAVCPFFEICQVR